MRGTHLVMLSCYFWHFIHGSVWGNHTGCRDQTWVDMCKASTLPTVGWYYLQQVRTDVPAWYYPFLSLHKPARLERGSHSFFTGYERGLREVNPLALNLVTSDISDIQVLFDLLTKPGAWLKKELSIIFVKEVVPPQLFLMSYLTRSNQGLGSQIFSFPKRVQMGINVWAISEQDDFPLEIIQEGIDHWDTQVHIRISCRWGCRKVSPF